MTEMFLISSMFVAPVCTFTRKFSLSRVTRPAPSFLRFASSASCKSLIVMPSRAISSKSGTTTIALAYPPKRFTSATPLILRKAGRMVKSSSCLFCASDMELSLLSRVNINISLRGVTMGASPPLTPLGKSPKVVESFSLTILRAR